MKNNGASIYRQKGEILFNGILILLFIILCIVAFCVLYPKVQQNEKLRQCVESQEERVVLPKHCKKQIQKSP